MVQISTWHLDWKFEACTMLTMIWFRPGASAQMRRSLKRNRILALILVSRHPEKSAKNERERKAKKKEGTAGLIWLNRHNNEFSLTI